LVLHSNNESIIKEFAFKKKQYQDFWLIHPDL